MARTILEKGSPEALAWAAKMKKAREAKKKSIRELGKFREIQHFGEMRKDDKPNPGMKVADYLKSKGWDLTVGKRNDPRVFSRVIAGVTQILQKEAQGWRFLQQDPHKLQQGFISAGVFPLLTDAVIRASKAIKNNPKKKEKIVFSGTAYKGYLIYPDLMKKLWYISKDNHHIGSASSMEQAKKEVDGLYSDNPPAHVSAKIAGVIYNRCVEIRAEKTSYERGYYKHPFSRSSKVCVLALDNGDILIHSKAGVNLWKPA